MLECLECWNAGMPGMPEMLECQECWNARMPEVRNAGMQLIKWPCDEPTTNEFYYGHSIIKL
jgi:hypothetical protein